MMAVSENISGKIFQFIMEQHILKLLLTSMARGVFELGAHKPTMAQVCFHMLKKILNLMLKIGNLLQMDQQMLSLLMTQSL